MPRSRPSRKEVIPVGLLFSLTGTYGVMGQEMLNGALLGLELANADPDRAWETRPVIMDPGGSIDRYGEQCETLFRQHGVRHIIGCYTSASRKRVLPLVEGAGALLWHPARYEGFECSDNVIYLGAAPNQHVVPLALYVLANLRPRVFCVGSNYVWSWETNRVMEEIITAGGGRIVAKRLIPLGELAIDNLVGEIAAAAPGAVLNTLVGESAYRFYTAWHEATARHPELRAIPMLSLSLSEAELKFSDGHRGGHIVSSVYFQSVDRPENAAFLARYRRRFGALGTPCMDSAAAYLCATMLGRAITAAGTAEVSAVRAALYRDRYEGPQGLIAVDPENNHAYLTPRLGRSTAEGQFEILWEAPKPLRPDPYLTWLDLDEMARPDPPSIGDPFARLYGERGA
ncbi:MAG: ABC transporter substrate-binding protein [Rhodovulum sulfidophilum]|uniref:ABC transporter substrate-binding protein n=1 Tax=Rhodovulum sulfidophilum TaxID=35806 RepID=A0A2W5NCD8_RHOSU|nr:MAG: ABC transporter substrate-binding protein [Rhodovulum sulfidophilum]